MRFLNSAGIAHSLLRSSILRLTRRCNLESVERSEICSCLVRKLTSEAYGRRWKGFVGCFEPQNEDCRLKIVDWRLEIED